MVDRCWLPIWKMLPGPVDGVAHGAPLGDGQRRRLLQVDVLAVLHRGDRDQRVPVIRRADDDGVDVLVGEQLAVVGVAGDAVVRLAGFLGVEVVDQLLAVLHAVARRGRRRP